MTTGSRPPHRRGRCGRRRRGGFTLVEVMATVLLMAIVLPAVTKAIAASTAVASVVRHRNESAGLAASKLAELTVTGQWQSGNLAGDFGPDWPDYRWQATAAAWANDTQAVGLQQLDVTVSWTYRGRPEHVVATGLVYIRPTASSSS